MVTHMFEPNLASPVSVGSAGTPHRPDSLSPGSVSAPGIFPGRRNRSLSEPPRLGATNITESGGGGLVFGPGAAVTSDSIQLFLSSPKTGIQQNIFKPSISQSNDKVTQSEQPADEPIGQMTEEERLRLKLEDYIFYENRQATGGKCFVERKGKLVKMVESTLATGVFFYPGTWPF